MDNVLSKHEVLERLVIKMYGKKYVLTPREDLELKPTLLGEALQGQPSKFAFYATVRDMCASKVDALAGTVKQVEAIIDQEIRSEEVLPSGGRITEAGVLSAIKSDDRYQKAIKDLSQAKFQLECLQSIVRAFEHRRECLLQLCVRANNNTWNDQDVDVTVSATIKDLKTVAPGVGKHPSKRTQSDEEE